MLREFARKVVIINFLINLCSTCVWCMTGWESSGSCRGAEHRDGGCFFPDGILALFYCSDIIPIPGSLVTPWA